MRHGRIENWDQMERLWSSIYSRNELGLDSSEYPAFLTESAQSPVNQTLRMGQTFFERFSVPAFFVAPQSLLSMYASGKGSGVVVDVGDGVTTCYPVFDGFTLTPKVRRADIGGSDITQYLQLLLRKSGHVFSSSGELEVVNRMKEACCECYNADGSMTQRQVASYALPDGNAVEVGSESLWRRHWRDRRRYPLARSPSLYPVPRTP